MVQNKNVKKIKKRNVVDLEHVMSRPETIKKKKSSMNIDDGVDLSSRIVCHDDELLEAEDDFHGFFFIIRR